LIEDDDVVDPERILELAAIIPARCRKVAGRRPPSEVKGRTQEEVKLNTGNEDHAAKG